MKQFENQMFRLRRAIESYIGRPLRTPSDFDWCSLMIMERSGERISSTTLKRLWGYLNEGHTPRFSTLSVLARFLGAWDWETWCAGENECVHGDGRIFFTKGMVPGDQVDLIWLPDRQWRIEYLGDDRFVVRRGGQAELPVDTIFRAVLFCGAPERANHAND